MKNMHIAFLCFPHQSHVHPTLSIVSTLIRRGHRVTFVTSHIFSARVSELGAEVIHCLPFLEFSPRGEFSTPDLDGMATRALTSVASLCELDRPDLMIYDPVLFAGRVLARRWNTPAITISPVLGFERANISQLGESSKQWRDSLISLGRVADRFLARHGIFEEGSFFHSERLNIYLYPKIYQLDGDTFDDSYFYAGRCAAERPCHGVWRPVNAAGRPIILVSMSTAQVQDPAYFKMCIDALSGLPYHVILAIGDYIDPFSLGALPPRFEIAQRIPLIQILPHVRLLIFQGGPASTVEAMYHGVPLVMITPGHPDLESYAENAVRLGIGIHLRKAETTAQSIKEAALHVLEDSMTAGRVKEIQKVVQREPGAEETANRIDDYFDEIVDCSQKG